MADARMTFDVNPSPELLAIAAHSLTAEQKIRARALAEAATITAQWEFDDVDEGARETLTLAERFATWITRGDTEPATEALRSVWAITDADSKVWAVYGNEQAALDHVMDRDHDGTLGVTCWGILDQPVLTKEQP